MTNTANTESTATRAPAEGVPDVEIAATGAGRLFNGQTSIDFVGRRRIGFIISGVLLVLTLLSITTRGLDLGIDFEGGISWDVPGNELSIAESETVLADNGIDPAGARIQRRASDSGEFIRIQVSEQPPEVQATLQQAFADAAGVGFDDVSTNVVSSSWGRDITDRAIRALLIFTAVVAVVIAIRYEWRMAIAAIVAMVHDVVIAVGIYSLLGFVVTPATVIAFLTILGYSLYDTIVIFDRVRENEARFEVHRAPYSDVLNTTMNQVLMRTINTSASSSIPVLSILVVGSGIMGAAALSEFAIALLVGILIGAYSSIFVAAPLLGLLKTTDERWRGSVTDRALGADLRALVMGGAPTSVRSRTVAAAKAGGGASQTDDATESSWDTGPGRSVPERPVKPSTGDRTSSQRAKQTPSGTGAKERPEKLLSHPPRPRKKKRR